MCKTAEAMSLTNFLEAEIWESLIMAALCNRAGRYIFALWFLLLSIFWI